MADHTYRVTEIVGSSPDSLQQAIRNGVARAGQTLHNLEWFEVSEIRGQIDDGAVAQATQQAAPGSTPGQAAAASPSGRPPTRARDPLPPVAEPSHQPRSVERKVNCHDHQFRK